MTTIPFANPELSRIGLIALMTLLLSCSGNGKEESAVATPAPESGSVAVSASGDREATRKELPKLIDAVVAGAGDLPRMEFDPAALARSLGNDPQAHFEWVRDRTAWAPYRGLLRGSQGVMLDRLGSNLDRAVLLGDLLRRAGHTVRLARAQLPEYLARKLLEEIRPLPDRHRSAPAPRPPSPERKRMIEELVPDHAATEPKRRAAIEEARNLVRSNGDRLQAAVQDITTNPTAAQARAALAAMRDHWWVERKDGDRWVAMDVLAPDARPGEAPVAATAISEWKEDAPAIPPEDWHSVQIRVVVERYESGAMSESTVLETTVRPATAIDRPIRFGHLPKQWPASLPRPDVDPNALGNAAINVREWVPQLQIGSELIVQSGFTDGGVLIAAPLAARSDVAETGGGGFMSGFGEQLGGGDTSSSSLTAEWIDYEIRVPGEPALRIRRPVFDLLGPVLRSTTAEGFDANTNDRMIARSEALLSQTDIFLQPCELTADYVSHLQTASIVAHQTALREVAAERDPVKAREKATALFDRLDDWGPLPSLARWRSVLGESASGWFIDRPNILNYRFTPPVVNADRATIKELIDIASNGIGVRQGSGNAFQVRMRQGVADTVAELVALGGGLRGAENTASIMTMAAQDNADKLVRPREAATVRDFGWPEDAVARLAANVGEGYMVVALGRPVEVGGQARAGWWRIDPATGETIGVMDTGYHQDLNERALTEFQLDYMMAYLRHYPPSIQARVAAEAARRAFWSETAPFLGFAASQIILFISLSIFA